tara:strand:+ start:131 stop:328 length:198 start_codon:yes stop_codon:yes gene_type:complete
MTTPSIPRGYNDPTTLPKENSKVDIIHTWRGTVIHSNNFAIYLDNTYWDSVGGIIENITAWKYRY